MIAGSLPYWPIDPLLASSPWYTFQLDMARCLWAILPPALLWGASFPLALAAVAGPGQDPAKVVGRIYAANTLGAIVGALGVSLILVPMARDAAIAAGAAGDRRHQRLYRAHALRARPEVGGDFRIAGRFHGACDGSADRPSGSSRRIDRLRPPDAAQRRPIHDSLHRRGTEFVGGDFALEQRRDLYQRQRTRGSHHRDLRYEAAADGGPSARSAASESEIGSGDRVWRGRFRRNIYPLSRDRAHHHLRNRAGDPADLDALLRGPELRGHEQSEAPGSCTTTPGTT